MKKIMILQIKSNSCGGIWFVNETLSNEFKKNNYEVFVLSIRKNPGPIVINENQSFKMYTINEKDLWEITRLSSIKKELKTFKFLKAFKEIFKKINDEIKLKKDYQKAKKIIRNYNPNYIISSHYQLFEAIPKEYLSKVIMHQHTSFDATLKEQPKAIKTFNKYKDKIAKFVWLTKATCNDAIKFGYKNSICIYNPTKFTSTKIADVINNKKLITMSRLNSYEKRIGLMLEIANDVLKKHKDWTLELYGADKLNDDCMRIVNSNKQIKLMGNSLNVKKDLLSSSIYLSTSSYEGFSLSIGEAYECGVPCVCYYFGEPTTERIIDGKTGFIIPFNNKSLYEEKLLYLMEKEKTLLNMSKEAKKMAKNFYPDIIIKEWVELFNSIKG